MTRSQQIARKINRSIKIWLKNRDKLIVALDGYAGSGKTTVANFIGKQNSQVLVIHLDDFINGLNYRRKIIKNEKDKSKAFEFYWYRYNLLEKLLKDFKSNKKNIKVRTYNYEKNDFSREKLLPLNKKVLLVEGVFLFHPKHKISSMWDRTIYLDINFKKADKQRIAREKKKWGKNYIPESHPDNWTKYFKKAYRRYVKKYKPKLNKDLMITINLKQSQCPEYI